MDAGIYILGGVILFFYIIFGMLDANVNAAMKQDLFESVRAANQNALIRLEEDYGKRLPLTSVQMVESWLTEFAKNNSLKYESLTISFVQLSTEPPLYLMQVEGYKDQYAVISGDAYAKYHSGSTIITR